MEKAEFGQDMQENASILDLAFERIRRGKTDIRDMFTSEIDYEAFRQFPTKKSDIYRFGDYVVLIYYGKIVKREFRHREREVEYPPRIGILGVNSDGKLFFNEIRRNFTNVEYITTSYPDSAMKMFRLHAFAYTHEPKDCINLDEEIEKLPLTGSEVWMRVQGDLVFEMSRMNDEGIYGEVLRSLEDAYFRVILSSLRRKLVDWLISFLSENRVSCGIDGTRNNRIVIPVTRTRDLDRKNLEKRREFQKRLGSVLDEHLKERLKELGIEADIYTTVSVVNPPFSRQTHVDVAVEDAQIYRSGIVNKILEKYYRREIEERAKEIAENPMDLSLRFSNHEIRYRGIPQRVVITTNNVIEDLPVTFTASVFPSNVIVITDPLVTIEHDEHGISKVSIISKSKVRISVRTTRSDDTEIRNRIALQLLIKKYADQTQGDAAHHENPNFAHINV